MDSHCVTRVKNRREMLPGGALCALFRFRSPLRGTDCHSLTLYSVNALQHTELRLDLREIEGFLQIPKNQSWPKPYVKKKKVRCAQNTYTHIQTRNSGSRIRDSNNLVRWRHSHSRTVKVLLNATAFKAGDFATGI